MDEKSVLKRYYLGSRESFQWKLDGLSERQLRMPLTPTGTNLLGLFKHVAWVDAGYLGEVFGRPFEHPVMEQVEASPDSDLVAGADEPAEMIKEFAALAWQHTDRTIDELPLGAPGRVPWWGTNGDVTLQQILVHVINENAQHLGHADILRELTDGAVGLAPKNTNLPNLSADQWASHTARLRAIAESFD